MSEIATGSKLGIDATKNCSGIPSQSPELRGTLYLGFSSDKHYQPRCG
jgi:hypothetical protein